MLLRLAFFGQDAINDPRWYIEELNCGFKDRQKPESDTDTFSFYRYTST